MVQIRPRVVEVLQAHGGPGKVIVEVGCGPGQYRPFVKGKYIGVDRTAEQYHEGTPRTPDIITDAASLPFAGNSVDGILYCHTLLLIKDYHKALGEAYRVLRAGGYLWIFDYNAKTQRRLGNAEGVTYPNWTWRGLERLVRTHGFKAWVDLPRKLPLRFLFGFCYPTLLELRETEIVVFGMKL